MEAINDEEADLRLADVLQRSKRREDSRREREDLELKTAAHSRGEFNGCH